MKEKSNVLAIVVALGVGLLIGLGIFLAYDKFFNEPKNNVSSNTPNYNQNDMEENPVDSSDNESNDDEEVNLITINLGKELFNKTLVATVDELYPLYNMMDKTIISYDDLAKDLNNISVALLSIPEEKWKINYDYDYSSASDSEQASESNYESKVKKDILENYFYELFGYDKNISYKNIMYKGLNNCSLSNNYIYCYPIEGGGDVSYESEFAFNNAKLEQGNLIVTAYRLGYNPDMDSVDINTFNNDLQKLEYGYNLQSQTENELKNKYNDDLQKFELTFKKDSKDNYYWYQTKKLF